MRKMSIDFWQIFLLIMLLVLIILFVVLVFLPIAFVVGMIHLIP